MATYADLRSTEHRLARTLTRLLFVLAVSFSISLGADARPAFADAACVQDTGGADDINATQKDLNEFCQSAGNVGGPAGCLAADAYLTWTWDDRGWSGSNTGDACALYDTDDDGFANFALCASVEDDPAVQNTASPKFYTCTNDKTLNCSGASVVTTAASTCDVDEVDDVFDGDHGGGNVCNGTNCTSKDTQAQCCVKQGDLSGTPELIDVCSYPSSSPSSSPSECVKAVLCNSDDDCSALDDACNVGKCLSDGLTKSCVATPKTDGTSCDDSNACTETDTCQDGVCTGDDAVTCTASDQCHDAGTCDPSTGTCSDPAKTDGATCDDSDACTQTDTCQSGSCSGADPVVCTASDQCHDAGTCDPGTGTCSDPAKTNDATCDDGDACTQSDTCQGGSCTGADPVVCAASDQCHDAGTCDSATGTCSNPAKANGSTCSDGSACTEGDTCQGGSCTAGSPVVCTALDQCHDAGTCEPSTGTCSNPEKANGSTCSDGNACTQTDTCQGGACTGSNGVTCPTPDQCHNPGTCDPSTGVCSNPEKTNGSTCSDGNACTQTDTCQGGSCSGSNPLTCTASDQCHVAGSCDPSSGTCSNPNKADGSTCTDGNACTQNDTCQSGSCAAGTAVVCSALDQCHVSGTCNTTTGVCSNPNAADGTSCSDGNTCTISDTCQDGSCVGGNSPTSEPGCKNDTGGADDAVGQKDLSQFCVASGASCVGTIFTWKWDDTEWTGKNTGDACALYDSDGDGFANSALCVTVAGKPAGQAGQSPRFYNCNDTKKFNCTGAALKANATSTCTASSPVTDPFAALASRKANKCSGPSCLTKDTQAQCCVKTADLPSGSTLIDVCSYPSQSPTSDPSECVKTVFCSSNADCTATGGEGTCTGRCVNVGGVNQCTF